MPKCSKEAALSLLIRRASPADIPALLDLDRKSDSSAHWSQEQYLKLFAENHAQGTGHLVIVAEALEARIDSDTGHPSPTAARIIASLVANKVDTEWELENIVVAEESRRGGMGSLLLGTLVEHVKHAKGNFIFLEVRVSNHAARSLYGRFGFEMTGFRKNYYSDPPEDAICYRRVVKKSS